MVLTANAVFCGVILVAVALIGIDPPSSATTELDQRVVPASAALARAERGARTSQQMFLLALSSPAADRGPIISQSQLASTRGGAAYREYQRLAFDTPAERRLQERYSAGVTEGQAVGATTFGLVESPDVAAYEAALANEQAISNSGLETLDEINQRFYTDRIASQLMDIDGALDGTRTAILIAFGLVLVIGLAVAVALLRGAFRDERHLAANEADRRREQHRSDLETQLQRGLEMEPTEEATFSIIGDALDLVRPKHPVELLVSDSSRAHFRQVLSTDAEAHGPGCPVTAPSDCPAASSGQTQVFPSGARLDACPFLRSREDGPHSAVCVPINIAGTNTGVIHSTGPDGDTPDPAELTELQLVARKSGDRIGFLRVLARTETQAHVDSLTGLFNRRSLEHQAGEVLDRGDPFVVAFADLDHFKELNDKHGHEMGDRALRLFGRVLRDSVRPADIPARFGGEEFVVLLPDCALADAHIVADRVRTRLASAIGAATVPPFTVTIGLAGWESPESFSDTIARADAALLQAKGAGRDQVLSAISPPVPNGSGPVEPNPEPVTA